MSNFFALIFLEILSVAKLPVNFFLIVQGFGLVLRRVINPSTLLIVTINIR